jgi:DDE superfamily endonuclease
MELWNQWIALVNQLDGAFSRKKTFFWFVIILIGFTIKFDSLGVTSIARGVDLLPSCYTSMLNFFSSTAVNLEALKRLWVQIVFKHFCGILRVNGRCIVVGDGIKVGKEGKKMPGVKQLHQESESNSKPEYIMGHSIQALCVLAKKFDTHFAVPLTAEIHEGVRFHYKDERTLLDKMIELLIGLHIPELCYLVVDKYYSSGRFIKQLVANNIHIVTMMKRSAVAYKTLPPGKSKRHGRPLKYGEKIKLFKLFETDLPYSITEISGITIEYYRMDLFWKPLGALSQFVFTRHPTKGNQIVMSTDLTADPVSLIGIYGLRFKIEVFFKQAVHQVGSFLYRFWLKTMKPKKRRSGDQLLQFASQNFKEKVIRKIQSYNLFIQVGFIAHGLLQYLSMYDFKKIWSHFGTWLRTIRENTLPSEMVVARAMSGTYSEFLVDDQPCSIFMKFLRKKVNLKKRRYEIPTMSKAS